MNKIILTFLKKAKNKKREGELTLFFFLHNLLSSDWLSPRQTIFISLLYADKSVCALYHSFLFMH